MTHEEAMQKASDLAERVSSIFERRKYDAIIPATSIIAAALLEASRAAAEREITDAMVEAAAAGMYESWANVPVASRQTWDVYAEKLPRGANHFRKHARAALIAAFATQPPA